MSPDYGPLPSFKGSEIWALWLSRVEKGYTRCPRLRPMLMGEGGSMARTLVTSIISTLKNLFWALMLLLGGQKLNRGLGFRA